MKAVTVAMAALLCLQCAAADVEEFREDFQDDPSSRWTVWGVSSLFRWNADHGRLEVTWDSDQPNSYLFRKLNTILGKQDDFELHFELQLTNTTAEVTGPFAFEIAAGFHQSAQATHPSFFRGSGTDSPNIVEWDYFPDTGYGATISPALVSSNNQFATSFTFPLELDLGSVFEISMRYRAVDQTLSVDMLRNGVPFGPIKPVRLGETFTDFRLDTVAISSYSDGTTNGRILVQGFVDNIRVITPPPPLKGLSLTRSGEGWAASFESRNGWEYTLERTIDLAQWNTVTAPALSPGGIMTLVDGNPPAAMALYRVRIHRP